jgi:tripartite-type tricarboxylate transporter receptor subunit TctC
MQNPHSLRRRSIVIAGTSVAAAGVLGLRPAAAQSASDWPQKAIKLVVPYAPGGSADTLGRLVGQHLGDTLKQPVVIDNKAGAGGLIGSQQVAKAPPDGYTLVVSGIGSHVIAPMEGSAPFDPMKDFTHIALMGGPPIAMVVNAQQPITDVASFISHCKSLPQGISWASPGQGTHGYLTGEAFRAINKLNMVHIAYKGAGPAVADLIAGQFPAAFMTLSSANAHIDSGKLRLLATTAPKRLTAYPNAPTLAELGYPQLTGTTWFAISGPPGLPRPIVEKLNAEIRHALQTPEAKKKMANESMVAGDLDAAAFTRYMAAEIERWGPMARSLATKK